MPTVGTPVGMFVALTAAALSWRSLAQVSAPQARADECLSRLKQTALALELYAQDNGERLPPADKWSDLLAAYTHEDSPAEPPASTVEAAPGSPRLAVEQPIFHCPSLGLGGWGYSMNWKLSRRALSEVESPATTASFYETNVPRSNAAYDGGDLISRHARLSAQGKPQAGGNYAFADGHVKWIPATRKPNFRIFLRNTLKRR